MTIILNWIIFSKQVSGYSCVYRQLAKVDISPLHFMVFFSSTYVDITVSISVIHIDLAFPRKQVAYIITVLFALFALIHFIICFDTLQKTLLKHNEITGFLSLVTKM